MADTCPHGWTHHTVKSLTTRHFSGPSPTCEERSVRNAQEWGLLKTTAITWAGWDQSAHKVPPRVYWGNRYLEVRSGDVLMTKAGPRHRVGVVVHVPSTQSHLMVSGKMVGLQPDTQKVISSVLAGLLSTPHAQKYLDQRTTGMAESQVNFADSTLLSTPLCVPPFSEQRRISQILDTLDEAIRRTEQIIAKLKQIKDGLLHDLLTRGIDDNGELRDPERRPEQFRDSPLGCIPKEWEIRELATCLRTIDQGWSPDCPDEPTKKGEWGVLKTTAVVWEGYQDNENKTLARGLAPRRQLEVRPGDVLMTRAGPNHRVAVVAYVPQTKGCLMLSDKLYRLQPLEVIKPEFLAVLLTGGRAQKQLAASKSGMAESQTNISQKAVRQLFLAIPHHQEQQAMTHLMISAADRIQSEILEREKLRLLKEGLIEDLLTGRVRVTNLEAAA